MNEISIDAAEMIVRPSSYDGFLDVDFEGSVKNLSETTWDFLKITVHLLNSDKYPVKENILYEKVTVKPNESFTFKAAFNSVPVKLLGNTPDCVIHISACESTHLAFHDLVLPNEPYSIAEIKPLSDSEFIKVLKAGIWKGVPDENRITFVQSFFQLQVMQDVYFPQVRLEIDLYERDGGYIDILTERKQAHGAEIISLLAADHIKERKLNQATAKVNIFLYKILASASSFKH